ncbi:MAG: hypothetical protein GY820_38815 [Gammaproteobacteria bacterium]|nr:hypothetical protein [Gammaproteobacteria bacterium]
MAGEITIGLIADLGLRLEDEEKEKFPQDIRLDALNYAQLRVAQLVNRSFLTELESVNTSVDISGGSVTLATVDSDGIIHGANGIIAAKVSPGGSNAQWATKTDIAAMRELQESSYFAESDSNVYFYVYGGSVYFLLTTFTGSVADIFYLDYPDEITTGVDPTLNKALHSVMTDFAESYCWGVDTESSESAGRRATADDKGLLQIKILNG